MIVKISHPSSGWVIQAIICNVKVSLTSFEVDLNA